ncbi:MAG: hypothetical protein NZ750_13540 [Anaerolineae bacterium]|nr:hypothetical protein [Anaerolineae bacterium]MDW8172822.1 hypothetical protein [Anaerolineae bacterium]
MPILSDPPLRLLVAFQQVTDSPPQWLVAVDGRAMWAAADCQAGRGCLLYAHDLGGKAHFDLRSARQQRTITGRPLPAWARLSAATALVLDEMSLLLPSLRLAMVGDEPVGARYSHALALGLVAICYAAQGVDAALPQLLAVVGQVRGVGGTGPL